MSIKIGSFNLCKMNYRTDNEIAKNYEKIAQIIKDANFDILAVQEAFNKGAINRLVQKLGSDTWDYIWASPPSKSVQAAEGYAFIWNKTRFRLATGTTKEEADSQATRATKMFRGRIEDDYRGLQQESPGMGHRLVRDPLYARFESIHGWYEIRLINTHIMFSSSKDEDIISGSDASKRNHEFDILVDIYRQIDDKVYRSKRPHYTILLGDYNLNLNCTHTKWPYLKNKSVAINEGRAKAKRIITVQSDLTTLKKTVQEGANADQKFYANNYDHFTYDEIRFNDSLLVDKACRIDTLTTYYPKNLTAHQKEISDHVPILLEFSLK